MLYTSEDIARINQFISNHSYKDMTMNLCKTEIGYFMDIELLGGMAVATFRTAQGDMVVNTMTSVDLTTVEPKAADMVIVYSLTMHIAQRCHMTQLSQGAFPARRMSMLEKESIDSKFNLPGNFSTIEAWAVGDTYLVYGRHAEREVLMMPYITMGHSVGTAVAMGLESGNYQVLGTKETERALMIAMDGYEFFLPQPTDTSVDAVQQETIQ